MAMEKIYKIQYVDARYSHEKKILLNAKLPLHEAYGYLEEQKDCLLVVFVKSFSPKFKGGDTARMGLVLPKRSLVSLNNQTKISVLKSIRLGTRLAVIFQDIVFFESTEMRDCPLMYTEGVLIKKGTDQIILKDPETIRAYPPPVINHPGGKPTFLCIPLGFIVSIEVIPNIKNVT